MENLLKSWHIVRFVVDCHTAIQYYFHAYFLFFPFSFFIFAHTCKSFMCGNFVCMYLTVLIYRDSSVTVIFFLLWFCILQCVILFACDIYSGAKKITHEMSPKTNLCVHLRIEQRFYSFHSFVHFSGAGVNSVSLTSVLR